MSTHGGSKIAIIGAGEVGATIGYACMLRGVAEHIVLYDRTAAKVNAQVLDLNHGQQFAPPAKIDGSDDPAICAGANVIVLAAGAKRATGQTRMDLASCNAEICRGLIEKLVKVAPDAIFLVVTNPVDVITHVTLKLSGFPKARVLGSGTVLDSSRFRFLIAQRLKVDVRNVHAYIAGEHGNSEFPLWSSAAVGGIPLHQWAVPHHGKLSVLDRTEIFQNVKNATIPIVDGKGATSYAIALATVEILQALLRDENHILPVSSLLENYRNISDVCLSIPSIVNANGVEQPLAVPMNANEEAGLKNSAEAIRGAISKLGF